MRKLIKTELNKITITDNFSNKDITLFHRMPTYSERMRYSTELYRTVEGKLTVIPSTHVKYGALIITGFEDAAYCDGNGSPLTTEPLREGKEIKVDGKKYKLLYREDWKDMLEDVVPEHLAMVASHVFNSVKLKIDELPTEEGIEIEVGEGDEPNFSKKM